MDRDRDRKRQRTPSPERRQRVRSSTATTSSSSATSEQITTTTKETTHQATSAAAVIAALEIQKQIAAQIASVSSLLNNVKSSNMPMIGEKRKAASFKLLLDEQGREIDEHGNLVKWQDDSKQIKTLVANVAVVHAQKKKENPYLLHKQPQVGSETPAVYEDPRLAHLATSRDSKAKKAFQFVEAGTFIQEEKKLRAKEERKVIGGYSSGRRAPEKVADDVDADSNNGIKVENKSSIMDMGNVVASGGIYLLPPPDDGIIIPDTHIEWWDEVYLPKELRETRKKSKAAMLLDNFDELDIVNSKTYKLIQHPIAVKPLGGDRADEPLTMFLTKKERKRVRKAAREEREREKRDKMMMGLIPTAEPKFKLSNFMKILGDQAVADPSKVEQRVVQQIQKRLLDHEMRNLANKLTPAERSEKQRRKLMEDTSRQVYVALFRVRNFNDRKHRFKVDVNAQQLNLTGIVLLCSDGGYVLPSGAVSGSNLVVVEGGPKGIRKMIHLMTNRIAWDVMMEADDSVAKVKKEHEGHESNVDGLVEKGEGMEVDQEKDDVASEDETQDQQQCLSKDNRCDLLWRGVLPKRTFQGFKFQECRSAATARKLLEARGVAHYWDMAYRADEMLEVARL